MALVRRQPGPVLAVVARRQRYPFARVFSLLLLLVARLQVVVDRFAGAAALRTRQCDDSLHGFVVEKATAATNTAASDRQRPSGTRFGGGTRTKGLG